MLEIDQQIERSANYPKHAFIGSIVRSTDESFWYCCGSWTVNGVKDAIPCILSYVPAERHTERTGQKTLELNGQRYLKAFGQPLASYRETYLPAVQSLIENETLGKVVFLSMRHIQEIKDPHAFVPIYMGKIPKDSEALNKLCKLIEVSIDDIGITGSTLMFGDPVKRHELDFGIYGRDKSKRAYKILEAVRKSGVIVSASDYHHLPFIYEGVEFDPQFGEKKGELNPIDGAKIEVTGGVENLNMIIKESVDAIFFPAIYETEEGRRLVSFRPGQRAFFKTDQRVCFKSMSVANITTADGKCEEVFLAINDESADVISEQ